MKAACGIAMMVFFLMAPFLAIVPAALSGGGYQPLHSVASPGHVVLGGSGNWMSMRPAPR